MTTAVIIPFRDRGTDTLRQKNLDRTLHHWNGFAPIYIVDDGRTGNAQFNRSAAYNRGAAQASNATTLIYTESDMLIDYEQINKATQLAQQQTGLVVPFTEYRYLSAADSDLVRKHAALPTACTPESTISPHTRSWPRTGPINVLTRTTLNTIGQWDETFQGNWWDDRAMLIAFEQCAGPTRFVTGPAHHLWHQPGWTGHHLTTEDRAATAANKHRYHQYRRAQTAEQIRQLTAGHT